MQMQIDLREPTLMQLRHASQTTGIQEEQLIQRAVMYYLDTIKKQVELRDEMQMWDSLSDEALMNFEEIL